MLQDQIEFLEKINGRCKLRIKFVEIKTLPKDGKFRAAATAYCSACAGEHTMLLDGEFADGFSMIDGFGFCVAGQVLYIEATFCTNCGNTVYNGLKTNYKKKK